MLAPTLAGELARQDRAVFGRASASPAMIRALVESLTLTDVRSRLAEVTVPTLDGAPPVGLRPVAERLYVSRYTVETHLKHVFAKLGVSSRAELAAVAPRNT
jgi:FixJ family two-component response regulator